MTIDTDRQLLNGLRKGYEDAFVELFNRYGRMMYALAYRYPLIPQSGLLKKNSKPLIKKPLQGLAYVCDFT